MKNYKYVAIDIQKKKFTGVFSAENEKDLAIQLSRQNLFLVSCKPYSGKTPSAFFTTGTGMISVTELSTFCREFSIMITAGVSMVETISLLKDLGFSTYFKSILQMVYEDVKSGMQLSESLNKHDKAFPEFFRSMVFVGEASGKLDSVFNALAEYYEKDLAMRKKVKGALAYPIMLIGMTIAIVALMLVFIIPTFKATLTDLNVVPQGFTKVVYDTSDFLVANWLYILAGIVAIGVTIFLVGKTVPGRAYYDRLKVNMPLFSTITVSLFCSRFARAFCLLLSSGLDMAESLDATEVIIENVDIRKRFNMASDEIKHGSTLANSFTKHKLFPPLMLQMIIVGEKTAELESVLRRSCDFFDTQAEDTVTSVTGKIQPIILCVMGIVIGTLFLAVYSPIISIMTSM